MQGDLASDHHLVGAEPKRTFIRPESGIVESLSGVEDGIHQDEDDKEDQLDGAKDVFHLTVLPDWEEIDGDHYD